MKYSDESMENIEKLENEKDKEKKKRRVLIIIIILLLISLLMLLFRLGRFANQFMGHIIETIVLSPEQKDDLPIDLCGRVFYSDDTPAAGYDIELHSNEQYDITDEHGDFYFSNVGYGSHQLILREEDGSEKVVANLLLERCGEITNGSQLFTLYADGTWRFLVPTETLIVEFDLELNEKGNRLKVTPESTCVLMEDSWVYSYFGSARASSVGPVLTPHGTLMMPDGTIHLHLGGARLPDGTMVNAEGDIIQSGERKKKSDLPDGYTLDSRYLTLTLPNGTAIRLKDRETALPDGVVANGRTAVAAYPDGTIVDNDNAIIITPDGYVIDENGNITGPDGKPFTGTTLPDGTRIHGDNTITTPDGSIIKKPQDHHGYIIDDGSDGWPGRPIGGEGTPGEPGIVPGDRTDGNVPAGGNNPGVPGKPGSDTPEGPGNTSGIFDGIIPPFPGRDDPKETGSDTPKTPGRDTPGGSGGGSSGGSGKDDPKEPSSEAPEESSSSAPEESTSSAPEESSSSAPGESSSSAPEESSSSAPEESSSSAPEESSSIPEESSSSAPEESSSTSPEESSSTSPSDEQDDLDVIDNLTKKSWRQLTTIDLFKDGGLIYPGASATYDFYIRNGVRGRVRYKMTITEAKHEAGAVPLEYRLKDGTGYIAGTSDDEDGWLTAAELEEVWVTIANKGNHHYTLEWRWPYERGDSTAEIADSDTYDTALANANNRMHYIHVKIYAENIQ